MKEVVPAPLNPFPYDVSGFASLRQREREIDRQTETERDRGTETAIQRERQRKRKRHRETFQGVGEWVREKLCFNLKPMAQVSI